MSPHNQSGIKLPDEQICEMVFEAGYNGMAIDLGASDVKKAFELRPIMERVGLTPLIVAFPKSIESLGETMKMAKDSQKYQAETRLLDYLEDVVNQSTKLRQYLLEDSLQAATSTLISIKQSCKECHRVYRNE